MDLKSDVENPHAQSSKNQKVLVWIGLVLGVLVAVIGTFIGQSLNETLGSILIGLGLLLPSLWWVHCESEDKKNALHYQNTVRANEDLSRLLADSDRHLLEGIVNPSAQRETDRRWPLFALVSIGLMVLGALVASVSSGSAVKEAEEKDRDPDRSEVAVSSGDQPTNSSSTDPSKVGLVGELQKPLSLSNKTENEVYLTIQNMTFGEECKYGSLLDDLQQGFQYLQLEAEFDVQKLGSPTYDLGEMLDIPRTVDSEGFTKDANWASSCMPSTVQDQWNVILNEGETARVYGAFVIPQNTEKVEIQGYSFEVK